MQNRNAVRALLVGALVYPTYSGVDGGPQPGECLPVPGGRFHGELNPHLSTYTVGSFQTMVNGRRWLDDKGVNEAPRRADCGEKCLYKGSLDERDDDVAKNERVSVSIHPICDAATIKPSNLPDSGVLIGRIVHLKDHPGSRRGGDASFNVRRRTPMTNPRPRRPDHYVAVFPSATLTDKQHYAIWKIISMPDRDSEKPTVVDSGLFRVCLPRHAISPDTLASFRSCAEVAELHDQSLKRDVQRAILGDQADSAIAQKRTFALLVRGDTAAIARLNTVDPRILFAPKRQSQSGEEEVHEDTGPSHGPFARAIYGRSFGRRAFIDGRYGNLQLDAPMWWECAEGCCSGEPW